MQLRSARRIVYHGELNSWMAPKGRSSSAMTVVQFQAVVACYDCASREAIHVLCATTLALPPGILPQAAKPLSDLTSSNTSHNLGFRCQGIGFRIGNSFRAGVFFAVLLVPFRDFFPSLYYS